VPRQQSFIYELPFLFVGVGPIAAARTIALDGFTNDQFTNALNDLNEQPSSGMLLAFDLINGVDFDLMNGKSEKICAPVNDHIVHFVYLQSRARRSEVHSPATTAPATGSLLIFVVCQSCLHFVFLEARVLSSIPPFGRRYCRWRRKEGRVVIKGERQKWWDPRHCLPKG
jgi:hypothetical protein